MGIVIMLAAGDFRASLSFPDMVPGARQESLLPCLFTLTSLPTSGTTRCNLAVVRSACRRITSRFDDVCSSAFGNSLVVAQVTRNTIIAIIL